MIYWANWPKQLVSMPMHEQKNEPHTVMTLRSVISSPRFARKPEQLAGLNGRQAGAGCRPQFSLCLGLSFGLLLMLQNSPIYAINNDTPNKNNKNIPLKCLNKGTVKTLVGVYETELAGKKLRLTLTPHSEFAGSYEGSYQLDGKKYWLAGDEEEGVLTLEESADEVDVSAVWTGKIATIKCAREISGERNPEPDANGQTAAPQAFIMRYLQPLSAKSRK